jgi:arsenite oxidase small subunit
MKLCATAGAAIAARPATLAANPAPLTPARPARLVDPTGRPLAPDDLEVGTNYVFHYPYVATPCFLLDLGQPVAGQKDLKTEDGRHYRWPGGTGPGHSIVAFSAICAHRMSYPTHEVSFIKYHHRRPEETSTGWGTHTSDHVIHCCSEGSVYDPTAGARVLAGPAKQPLAAIDLSFDKDDGFTAAGTYGGDMFDRFFAEFEFQLVLEHGTDAVREPVGESTTVWPLSEYSANERVC